ncbi:hypothetical protein DL98DRAFT_511304 [Cadophora sp. DSE1049]|nr:hypothetical protein DL98DRAFT_511304 [Cadophora sp. DSE1049]
MFKLPMLLISLLPRLPHASPNKRCSGSERQTPDCEISYPSQSTSLSPPSIFRLPLLILSLLPTFRHADPILRPAAFTNSIADPNFDLVRKSVGEMMHGLGNWLGGRKGRDGVEAHYGEQRNSTGQAQCGKTARGILDSAGSRAGVGKTGMAGLGVSGVAVVFAGFL